MIESPCWNCNGEGRPGCSTCQGIGRYRTFRLDAWSRRKLFWGSRDKHADSKGDEKWSRYATEIPPEFDALLAEAHKIQSRPHVGVKNTKANIVRIALFEFLERHLPEEAPPIESTADDVVVLPALPVGGDPQ